MRTSGLGISLLLIAGGAVLAWAVDVDTEGVNLNTIGIILFVVGVFGVLATMVLTSAGAESTVVRRDREVIVDTEKQRDMVVDRD